MRGSVAIWLARCRAEVNVELFLIASTVRVCLGALSPPDRTGGGNRGDDAPVHERNRSDLNERTQLGDPHRRRYARQRTDADHPEPQ